MNSDLEELLGDCSKKHKLDESDPLLDEIAKLMHGEEKTDRAIADSLAKIIQSRWLNKLNEEQRKNVCGKYLGPSNNKVINPRVNPEIWKRFDQLSAVTVTKVEYICAKTKDLLLKARGEKIKSPDTNELIRMNADAIAPLGHTNFEISQRRRECHKTERKQG